MTHKSKVWFDSKDLKALGDPFHEVGAAFAGEIEWDYYEDQDGSYGIHWLAYRLDYLWHADILNPLTNNTKWISIKTDKRCIDILGKKFNCSRGPTSLSYLS